MVTFAISLNILISLLGFYTAGRLWQWRKRLTRTADTLEAWNYTAERLWQPPGLTSQVLQGQQSINCWRQQYGQLERQLRQLQQILKWAGWVPLGLRWQQRTRSRSSHDYGQSPRQR